jgi:hypothetical protein
MAVSVSDYESFKEHYSRHRSDTDLFGFLLYATSESHKPVAAFARTHWAFLDQLAVNQQMFLYFFALV